jgi:Ca-activated chloride channel family protein
MKRIVQDGLGKMRERDIDTRMSRHPIERYQWPLGLGLALVAASMLIGERRRSHSFTNASNSVRAAFVALALFFVSQSSNAASLNKGIDLYNDQKYKEAYSLFQKQLAQNPDSQALHFDSGTAAYKSGDYDKAIESFSKATASPEADMRGKSEYNLANALSMRGVKQESKDVKLKDLGNALQHYDEALKIDPKAADAKFNRDVVAKLIEDLKKEPPKQKQDEKKDSKQDNNKDKDQKQDQQKQQDKQNKDEKNSDKDKQQQDQSGSQDQKKDDDKSGKDSQKDQQKQDSQQDSKKEDGQNSQSKNGQQNKDSSQSGNDGQKQDSDKQDLPKQGDQQQPQTGQNQNGNDSQQNKNQPSDQPTPAPAEDKKFSGDIKDKSDGKSDETQNAQKAEPYVPGQERAMSADEAQRVIESAKDEDAKGVLIERKGSAPVLKDW